MCAISFIYYIKEITDEGILYITYTGSRAIFLSSSSNCMFMTPIFILKDIENITVPEVSNKLQRSRFHNLVHVCLITRNLSNLFKLTKKLIQ